MSIIENLRTALGMGAVENPTSARVPAHPRPRGRYDPCLRDPQARQLRAQLERGDWQTAHKFLEGTPQWRDRDFYVSTLCDWPDRPSWLDDWTRYEQHSSLGWLMSGAHGVRWAWQARGSGVASTVGGDDALLFLERLEMAEEDLHRAISLNGTDSTPWTFLLITGRGLGVDLDEHERRFGELCTLAPLHRHGHSMSLQHRCEKWYGSHDAMFAFARAASRTAPDGDPLHGIVAEAHIERWLMIDSEEAAALYWTDGAIADEIREAAARSVLSPAHATGRYSILEHNLFAFCAVQLEDREMARTHFERCRGLVTRYPWSYLGNGDPAASFNAAQLEMLT